MLQYHAAVPCQAPPQPTTCWPSWPWLQIFDRTVKGIREAPSKALVGDLANQSGDSPAAAFSE
jgi:hypothetical protein